MKDVTTKVFDGIKVTTLVPSANADCIQPKVEGGVVIWRLDYDDTHLGALPAHKMQLVCTLNTPVSLK